MYLYNEFIINILNNINNLLCTSKSNSKQIELTVHTSCYWGLRLTLCYKHLTDNIDHAYLWVVSIPIL